MKNGTHPPSPFLTAAALLLLGAFTWCQPASGQAAPSGRAAVLIKDLQMEILPKESGYISIIGASSYKVADHGTPVPTQSQIYYMLTDDLPINYLHWLASDDTHILIEGGPVDYYIFCRDGHAELKTLGMDLANGQRPLVAVPAGCWKALRLRNGAQYALMASVVTPAWSENRVRIGETDQWIARFAGAEPWATPSFLRTLIGPNTVPTNAPPPKKPNR